MKQPSICVVTQQVITQWEEETGASEACLLPEPALLSPALCSALPPTRELVQEQMQAAQTASAAWLHYTAAWNALPTPK